MAKRPKKKTRKQKKVEKERLAKDLNEMTLPKPKRVGVTTTRYVE